MGISHLTKGHIGTPPGGQGIQGTQGLIKATQKDMNKQRKRRSNKNVKSLELADTEFHQRTTKHFRRFVGFSLFFNICMKVFGGFNYSQIDNVAPPPDILQYFLDHFGTSKNVTKYRPRVPYLFRKYCNNDKNTMDKCSKI